MQPKLLHLIAWLPAHRFGSFSMSLAVFAWHWICAESPHLQVHLPSCSILPCLLLTGAAMLMTGMSSHIPCFQHYCIWQLQLLPKELVLSESQASQGMQITTTCFCPKYAYARADVLGACPSIQQDLDVAEGSPSHSQSLSYLCIVHGCSGRHCAPMHLL